MAFFWAALKTMGNYNSLNFKNIYICFAKTNKSSYSKRISFFLASITEIKLNLFVEIYLQNMAVMQEEYSAAYHGELFCTFPHWKPAS